MPPRASSAAVWVKSLLLRLAVTALWFLSVTKVPCEGRVASLGVPSSSLEKRWVCQPSLAQTNKKNQQQKNYAGPAKAVLPEPPCRGRRLLLGRGGQWGWASRQGPCQAGCFPGKMWKEGGQDINQLSWWQDSSILALAFTRRKLSVCGNGVCVHLVVKTQRHNPCLPVTRFSSKCEDNQKSPGKQLLLALGHCELAQHFS